MRAAVLIYGTTPTTAPHEAHCTKFCLNLLPLTFASFSSKRVQSHLGHLDIAIIIVFRDFTTNIVIVAISKC